MNSLGIKISRTNLGSIFVKGWIDPTENCEGSKWVFVQIQQVKIIVVESHIQEWIKIDIGNFNSWIKI